MVSNCNQADFHKWANFSQCSSTIGLLSRIGSISLKKFNKCVDFFGHSNKGKVHLNPTIRLCLVIIGLIKCGTSKDCLFLSLLSVHFFFQTTASQSEPSYMYIFQLCGSHNVCALIFVDCCFHVTSDSTYRGK